MTDSYWVILERPKHIRPKRERRRVLRMLKKGKTKYWRDPEPHKHLVDAIKNSLDTGTFGVFAGIKIIEGRK